MLKRALFVLLIFLLVANTVVLAEEEVFRFTNWPLEGFENRPILTPFSNSHFGVDVAGSEGEDVRAAADGKVYWTYSGGSNGISVGIEHQNGWRTTYLHLSERQAKKGQEVKAGDVIGKVGRTGTGRDADETHLHFALIIDPKSSIEDSAKRYANPLLYAPMIINNEPPKKEEEPLPAPQPEPQQQPAPEIPLKPAVQIPVEAPVVIPQPAELALPARTPIQITKEVQISKKQVNQTELQPTSKAPVNKSSFVEKKKVSAEFLNEAKAILSSFVKESQPKDKVKQQRFLTRNQVGMGLKPVPTKNNGSIFLSWIMLLAAGAGYSIIHSAFDIRKPELGSTC